MRNDEHNFDRDHRNRSQRSGESHHLSDYQSRYEDKGNYYGMPDRGYHNVRSQGNTLGNSSGVKSRYNESSRHSDQDDRRTQGRMHQNEWGGNADYNRGNQGQGHAQHDHYHYGDPNPYMHNQRNRSYDNRDDWRSEGVDHANRRYNRQENSYRQTGFGRRFDQYGRDEKYNYAHGPQDGRRSIEHSENLDDRYYDRGEHSRSSSDNDYGRRSGSQYEHRNRRGRDDDYESRRHQDRDQSPSRSPRGYGLPSGPDYSANSPISNYGPGVRGHQK